MNKVIGFVIMALFFVADWFLVDFIAPYMEFQQDADIFSRFTLCIGIPIVFVIMFGFSVLLCGIAEKIGEYIVRWFNNHQGKKIILEQRKNFNEVFGEPPKE